MSNNEILPNNLFLNILKARVGKITTIIDLKRSIAHFKLFQQLAPTPCNTVRQYLHMTIAHTNLILPAVLPVSYMIIHMQRKTIRTERLPVQFLTSDSGCLILLFASSNTN